MRIANARRTVGITFMIMAVLSLFCLPASAVITYWARHSPVVICEPVTRAYWTLGENGTWTNASAAAEKIICGITSSNSYPFTTTANNVITNRVAVLNIYIGKPGKSFTNMPKITADNVSKICYRNPTGSTAVCGYPRNLEQTTSLYTSFKYPSTELDYFKLYSTYNLVIFLLLDPGYSVQQIYMASSTS